MTSPSSPKVRTTASDAVSENVLEVRDLKTCFFTEEGALPAVNGVTFSLPRGKTLAIVGESGCGKSVTAYSILRLIQNPGRIAGGSIRLAPKNGGTIDMVELDEKSELLYAIRGGLASMIFQEPMTALSPVHTIGNQICEAILLHQSVSKREAERQAVDMLKKVGIPGAEKRMKQYPFEFSGGMRQRVVIAMALVCNPELLIADEPTTALDVTIQAQILNLIKRLQQETGTSVLLITHDLGVVAQTADQVAVMYLGRIVEQADVRSLLRNPRHPYTRGLLESLPGLNARCERLKAIQGSVPALTDIPPGCPFHPRCRFAVPGRCNVGSPPPLEKMNDGSLVACIRAEEIQEGGFEGRVESCEERSGQEPPRPSQPETRTSNLEPRSSLLSVRNLCKYFPIKGRSFFQRTIGTVRAVDDISFDLATGETLGIVGESGSGKTTTARTILRALEPTSGEVHFRTPKGSVDLARLSERELIALRPLMQMIFQDPFSSLNPRMTVGDIVGEPLLIHHIAKGSELNDRVEAILTKVGLKPDHRARYPHAFSGGQRQRIGIARALILNPSLVVADEAVSALDVSVQAQVINLLEDLQEELNLTYIFVAHDLSVVRHICDRVAVMYGGRIVETGPTEAVFETPQHPYTKALLAAIPWPDPDHPMVAELQGDAADPANLPPGCAFHPRCPECFTPCDQERPPLHLLSGNRHSACHLHNEAHIKSGTKPGPV